MANSFEIVCLGTMNYRTCLQYQHELHQKVASGIHPGAFILVQHPSVITLGNRAPWNSVLATQELLQIQAIDVVETDRGGDATAHEPGQLVVYPILPLGSLRLGPKSLVKAIEQSVITWLANEGIRAAVDQEHPGVWVGHDKICAIGLRFKDRASYHGFALNLVNDLKTFQWIVPCGIQQRGVVSLQGLTGRFYDCESVGKDLLALMTKSII